ncbi:Blue copper oxidase CueO precursor, partial [hydrothermal vent metagenome]
MTVNHPRKLSRRAYLSGLAAVGAVGAVGALPRLAYAGMHTKRLAMPPLLDATKTGRFSLRAQAGKANFMGRSDSNTIGFNQSYLGPVVRVAQGETEVTVENSLKMPVSTHWHGLVIPGEVDGGPHQPVDAGGTWKITLPITQPTATAWYHSHIHGQTATQVYAGLAGVLQISDGRDDERGLPSTYGEDDLMLVVQDRSFDRRGRMNYAPNMHGVLGDTIVVNGQVGRVAAVPAGIVRLRVLNGSNARIYRLAMASGRQMHLIASEAGLLPEPLALPGITLAPGERVEILVDFAGAESDSLVSALVSNTPMMGGMMGGGMMGGGMMGGGGMMQSGGGSFELQRFKVDPGLTPRITRLAGNTGEVLPDLSPEGAVQRRFTLDMGMGAMMGGGGMMGGMMGGGSMGGGMAAGAEEALWSNGKP